MNEFQSQCQIKFFKRLFNEKLKNMEKPKSLNLIISANVGGHKSEICATFVRI